MKRVLMLALLTFGCVSAQVVPAQKYEFAYLVSGTKVRWVEKGRSLEGTQALCEAMLGVPSGCETKFDQINALGMQGWFPVAGLFGDPQTGMVYFYRPVR